MKDTFLKSQKRKYEHIQICQSQMVESIGGHELDAITLQPESLPEFNFDEIDTSQYFLNTKLGCPASRLTIARVCSNFPKNRYWFYIEIVNAKRFILKNNLS